MPVPAATGSRAALPHPVTASEAAIHKIERRKSFRIADLRGKNQARNNGDIEFARSRPVNDIHLAANAR
jgi:hypothetical protein